MEGWNPGTQEDKSEEGMESRNMGEGGIGLCTAAHDKPMLLEPRAWPAVVAICLMVAGVYWFIDSRTTLWDRDEPRFSRATAEMIESGNYLYPTFNGHLRPDKPVLIYWLMSLPMRVLGPTALACRFWSSAGIALTCLFTFLLARRFLDTKAGLWSMVILVTTPLILIEGTAATSDGVLLPCMVAAVVLFGRGLAQGWRWYHGMALGLALGLGLLDKGPVALLPVVVIVVTLWLIRRSETPVRTHLGWLGGSTAAGMLLFLAWGIPANHATGGEFLRLGIGHHVLARAARPLEDHGGRFLLHLPYYVPILFAGFFPWTLHLPGAVCAIVHRRVGTGPFRELFLAWVVSVVVIMTLAATKLPHYILFAWPALALAVGGTLTAAARGKLAEIDHNWLRGGIYFFGPMAGVAVVGFFVAPLWLHLPGALAPFWTTAALLLAISVLAMRQQLQNRPQASAITLLLGLAVLAVPVLWGVIPLFENAKVSPTLAQAITRQTAPDVPVATFGYGEPSMNFYIGRPIETLFSEQAIVEWAQQPQPGVLIIPEAALVGIEQRRGSLGLAPIASKGDPDFAKGTTVQIAAVLRRGGHP